MGSLSGEEGRNNDESPQHVVRIDYRFAVGMYEVTFAEWDACVNAEDVEDMFLMMRVGAVGIVL